PLLLFHPPAHLSPRLAFPTRRSSDLAVWCTPTPCPSVCPVDETSLAPAELIVWTRPPERVIVHRFVGPTCGPRLSTTREQTISSDRKSTRLNSSHQITSYAVFCLKKK